MTVFTRPLAPLLTLLAISCGGSTEDTPPADAAPQDCENLPTLPFGSDAAVRVARCAIDAGPSRTSVVAINSGPAGAIDSNGLSDIWAVYFWDPATDARHKVGVKDAGTTVEPLQAAACSDAPSDDPAASTAVVPNAEQRYLQLAAPAGDLLRYFSMERDCGALFGAPFRGVWVGDEDGGGETKFRLFRYDWEGRFVEHCGPCTGSGFICDPCTPG